jgi:hypothetical protein
MKIYSGECEHGECGLETKLVDNKGQSLRIGDIVCLAHKGESGYFEFYGVSAIVDYRPERYIEPIGNGPFVMGLISVDINTNSNWIVERVKKWEDVLDGEHWADYGFNYQKD